jgi:hypothetical protein
VDDHHAYIGVVAGDVGFVVGKLSDAPSWCTLPFKAFEATRGYRHRGKQRLCCDAKRSVYLQETRGFIVLREGICKWVYLRSSVPR